MANVNCKACEDVKSVAPTLACEGFSDEMCTSLQNDTGLSADGGNNDCTDLDNLNDCLIGNEDANVELYEVCDWKKFMHEFIPNLWTMLKAIICAICGIWTNIHNLWNKVNCVYDGIVNLINKLDATTQGTAFVRYYRDQGSGVGETYDLIEGQSHTIDIYMDASGTSSGSQPADRDYIVQIANCTNMLHFHIGAVNVTYYASDDTRSIDVIRQHQAQHAAVRPTESSDVNYNSFSWTTSGSVLVRKGKHVKVDSIVEHASAIDGSSDDPVYRLHQFVLTWIPINIDSSIDPDDILDC